MAEVEAGHIRAYERMARTGASVRHATTQMNFGWVGPQSARVVPSRWPQPRQAALLLTCVAGVALDGRTVAEIGAGRCGNLALLRLVARPRALYGVELGAGNLARAAALRARRRTPDIHLVRGRSQQIPLATGSVDVLLCVESAHGYERIEAFTGEAGRVTRAGGTFVFADVVVAKEWDRFVASIEGAGFVCERIDDLTAGVLRSLDIDALEWDPRRLTDDELFAAAQPGGWLWKMRASPGSPVYMGLTDGRLRYSCARFRRTNQRSATPTRWAALGAQQIAADLGLVSL